MSCVLVVRCRSRVLVQLEAGREFRVLALKRAAREREHCVRECEHCVLLQKHGTEHDFAFSANNTVFSLYLLMTSLASSSTISIPLGSQELLRTPAN